MADGAPHLIDPLRHLVIFMALIGAALTHAQEPVEAILSGGAERIRDGQAAQARVEEIHQQTIDLVTAFEDRLRTVDGLKSYNHLLGRQIENQHREMAAVQKSIADAAVIERQIIPLLLRMVGGLEDFVRLDLPFLLDERLQRVATLRSLLERSDITATEKTRRIFEAYQIESDFGTTIEAYRDKLSLNGDSVDAEFLRIGRVALLYRTLNNDQVGYWDANSGNWRPLDGSTYRRHVDAGLKIARQELAPELMTIPVPAPAELK